jgi:hypothetical protein
MAKRQFRSYLLLVGPISLFAGILLAQTAPERPLIVNGKPAGNVLTLDSHSYVDVETLAQATNGSVTIEPNRVVLNLPSPPAGGQTGAGETSAQEPAEQRGLSKQFARQAIEVLAEMREWRGAIGTILMYNTPVVGTWPEDYRARVQSSLDQLDPSAITADDRMATNLIENQFQSIDGWAEGLVSARRNLDATNSVRATALQEDRQLAKITACTRFLSSMLASGQLSDDPSCH